MTPLDFEKMLRQTLADRKLSSSERTALTQVLADARLDGQKLAAHRAVAFDLAREAIGDPHAREVLDWLEAVVKLMHPVKPAGAAGTYEALFAPFDDLPARVVGLFAAVRASADLCVFTITDDRLSQAILSAHRRGVRVRIITDDDKSSDLGSDVEAFEAAGIPVRVDRTSAHMHHKFAVFDDRTLLNGSYNWTRSAATVNNENFIVTSERLLVDTFARHFEKLWAMLG